MATSTYSIPRTLTELTKVTAKLASAELKASTVRTVHEMATYLAWRVGAIDGLAADETAATFATAIGRTAGHVSKIKGILNADHAVSAPFTSKLDTVQLDDVATLLADMVQAVDRAARADETSKRHFGKGAATVDAIYSYLGIGKSGGAPTWEGTLNTSAKAAHEAGVSKAAFLARAAELADAIWS